MSNKDADKKQEPAEVAPIDPAELLNQLEKKARLYKILLIVGFGLWAINLLILAPAYFVIHLKMNELERVSNQQALEGQFQSLQKDIESLREARAEEVVSIEEFSHKLEALKEDKKTITISAAKQILLDREADYQKMTGTLTAGMEDLSNMVTGDRSWVKSYASEMNNLKIHSIERVKNINSSINEEILNENALMADVIKKDPSEKHELKATDQHD